MKLLGNETYLMVGGSEDRTQKVLGIGFRLRLGGGLALGCSGGEEWQM